MLFWRCRCQSNRKGSLMLRQTNAEKIKEMLKNIRLFLLDMDGTFYLEDLLLEGSMDFLRAVEKTGRTVRFLTNNSSKSGEFYAQRLRKMGVDERYLDVITSGQAACSYCLEHRPNQKCYLLGNDILKEELSQMGLNIVEDDADYVMVAFDTTLDYQKLCKVCDYIRYGKPYIATHPDFNCPTKEGFIPDVGSFMALIEASTGRRPDLIIGKPHEGIVKEAVKRTGCNVQETAMVGDRLYTDIATAKNFDMLGILVLTGETKIEDVENSKTQPDLIFERLSSIIPYL
jgi:HAD superfamily hydrolase (TIGR01450 family)